MHRCSILYATDQDIFGSLMKIRTKIKAVFPIGVSEYISNF